MPDAGVALRLLWTALAARSTGAFYDRLAPAYDRIFVDHRRHARTMIAVLCRACPEPSRAPILDLGCGTGIVSRALARRGFAVTGLDVSLRSLAHLRRNRPDVSLVCGDAGALPFSAGRFRAVTCLGAWRHFADPERVADEIRRVLSRDGLFLVGTFPPKLGGLWRCREDARGRLAARCYRGITRALGYVDAVEAEDESRAERLLRARFRDVRSVRSGRDSRLLRVARARVGRLATRTP